MNSRASLWPVFAAAAAADDDDDDDDDDEGSAGEAGTTNVQNGDGSTAAVLRPSSDCLKTSTSAGRTRS